MEFDIDAALAAMLPETLSLKIGGVKYTTRPLAVGDLALLTTLEKAPLDQRAAYFVGLFPADSNVPVGTWDIPIMSAVLAAIVGFVKELLRKNSLKVAADVQAAIAKQHS